MNDADRKALKTALSDIERALERLRYARAVLLTAVGPQEYADRWNLLFAKVAEAVQNDKRRVLNETRPGDGIEPTP